MIGGRAAFGTHWQIPQELGGHAKWERSASVRSAIIDARTSLTRSQENCVVAAAKSVQISDRDVSGQEPSKSMFSADSVESLNSLLAARRRERMCRGLFNSGRIES